MQLTTVQNNDFSFINDKPHTLSKNYLFLLICHVFWLSYVWVRYEISLRIKTEILGNSLIVEY